jgi:zinc-ribbon domain
MSSRRFGYIPIREAPSLRSVRVGIAMNCPNCGLANPDTAKFCANCGTSFTGAPQGASYQGQSQSYQPPPPPRPYQMETANRGGNSLAKNIGLGCLIFLLLFLFFGLSCTRSCFGHRRTYVHRRY